MFNASTLLVNQKKQFKIKSNLKSNNVMKKPDVVRNSVDGR